MIIRWVNNRAGSMGERREGESGTKGIKKRKKGGR
jgi:hypothetical protein